MLKLVLLSFVAAVMCAIPNTLDSVGPITDLTNILVISELQCFLGKFPKDVARNVKENTQNVKFAVSKLDNNVGNTTDETPVTVEEISKDNSDGTIEQRCKGKDFFIITYRPPV